MTTGRAVLLSIGFAFIVAAALLPLAVPCQAPPASSAGGSFEGDWSSTGTRQILPAGEGRKANISYFSGSLLLKVEGGLGRGFRAEVIAYDDGKGLSVGSCVWTDERGGQVFSEMSGQSVEAGKHIHGTFTGGTGRYAGIEGEYEFDWQFVIVTPDGEVQGRVTSLKGTWSKGPAAGEAAPGKAAP